MDDRAHNLDDELQRLRRAVDGTSDGLWDWVPGSDRVWYSRRFLELLGCAGGPTPGHLDFFNERLHPEDIARTWDAVNAHLDRGIPYDIRYRLRHADGGYRWFRARGHAVRDASGRPRHMAGSIQDIDELVRREEELLQRTRQLERSTTDLDEFVYVVSHDLKSPLRGILQLSRWISDDPANRLSPESASHFEKLRARTLRLNQLLDDLLAYSRVGRNESPALEIECERLVRDVAAQLPLPPGFLLETRNLPVVVCPAPPLELVFRNLIDNAVKHHDRNEGRILVSARGDGPLIEFSVEDDGPGIEPRYHKRVFDIFATLKPRDEVEGSGMGLALVRRTVENQGGTTWLESKGRGARLSFTWPRTVEV